MWFLFALTTALCWGGADLFYKKGSQSDDKLSHLKIVVAVGFVMGAHALIYWLATKTPFSFMDIVRYLPVSLLYILSMALGYVGLRYIELSVSSPIQNSSGAVTTILLCIFFTQVLGALEIAGIVAITLGLVALAFFERSVMVKSDPITGSNKKYAVGFLAILFPILYCVIDGLGTFADAIYLDELQLMGESQALLAYEFTFLFCALLAYLYIRVVKKQPFKLFAKPQKDRWFAALLETAGQYFYVFAMAQNAVVAAPLIASYSIFSVVLSRIFLKEKLTKWQYVAVFVVLAGIALLGLAEEL